MFHSRGPNFFLKSDNKELNLKDYLLLSKAGGSPPSATIVSDGISWQLVNQFHGGSFWGDFPKDLNSTAAFVISENMSVGSVVGVLSSTDPDGGAITYQFVSGKRWKQFTFSVESNGTLKTTKTFNFSSDPTNYSIRVQAKDEHNATIEDVFAVNLINQVPI